MVHLAQPRLHHQTARHAQLQSRKPCPTPLAEHIRDRLLEPLLVQHRLQLVLRSCPLPPQRDPQPHQQAQLLRRLIGHPRLGQKIAARKMRQSLRIHPVVLQLRRRDRLHPLWMNHHQPFRLRPHGPRKRRPKTARFHHHLPGTRNLPQPRPQRRTLVHHLALLARFSACIHRRQVTESLVKIYSYVGLHGVPSS